MSFTKIWIHIVWTTKYKNRVLSESLLALLIPHIKTQCYKKRILLECTNGFADHMHALIRLRPDQSLAEVVQLIKGESSFWINKHNLTRTRFAWQTNYYAIAVSPRIVPVVVRYIENQKEKHSKAPLSSFLKRGGFVEVSD